MLITLSQASEITGISASHLRLRCRQGKIPGIQMIGKTYVVPIEWAQTYAITTAETISVQEAAKAAGVSTQAIYLAVRRGALKKTNARITKKDFDEYMNARCN